MNDAIVFLIHALAYRPEILGIVALSGLMAWSTRKKAERNGTAMFRLVIHAELAGVYLLGTVLIIREIGRQLDRFF